MRIEQLDPFHMMALRDQGAPGAAEVLGKVGYLTALVTNGPAFAGVCDEGVIGAMGMNREGENEDMRYRCWAITDPKLLPPHLVAVCRAMHREMNKLGARRIETIVMEGNGPAHRWVRLLGFTNPHRMSNFNKYGDAWMYERVGVTRSVPLPIR